MLDIFLVKMVFIYLQRTRHSRVLNVSSISHEDIGRLDPADVALTEHLPWDSFSAYSLSKLALTMWTHELALRTPTTADGLSGPVILHCDPGTVNTKMLLAGWGPCGISVNQANDEFTLVAHYDAASHGKYYVGCRETECLADVYDQTLRQIVWARCEALGGISFPML